MGFIMNESKLGLCEGCVLDPQTTVANLLARIRVVEMHLKDCQTICASCARTAPAEPCACESIDCPWLFARKKAEAKIETTTNIKQLEDLEDYHDV